MYLDFVALRRNLADTQSTPDLRRQLLSIAGDIGGKVLGVGVAHQAWRPLGLTVVPRKLRGLSGYCQPARDGYHIILVEERDDPRRQRFTVAHELAHLLLLDIDRQRIALSRAQEERLCDEFAARLLIPASDLEEWLPDPVGSPEEVLRVCARYNVSIAAALARLGARYGSRGVAVFAASLRAHPQRPRELALRAHRAKCGDVLIPDYVRTSSLGLGQLETQTAPSQTEGISSSVCLPLWRPGGRPRSGRAEGTTYWRARTLHSGLRLIKIELGPLELRWSKPRGDRASNEVA